MLSHYREENFNSDKDWAINGTGGFFAFSHRLFVI